MKKIIVVTIVLAVMAVMVLRVWTAEGIVIVPGYEHGVAICNGGKDEALVTIGKEAHIWKKDGIFYTVNYGHLKDKEVEELQYWAKNECAQYFNK